MQRVKLMICLESVRDSYKTKTRAHIIDDDSARAFVELIERGVSLDCVLEILMGCTSTYSNSDINESRRALAVQKLIRNKIVRESALFCALLGVGRILLAQYGLDRKFDKQKDAILWLELCGYSKLPRGEYRDCVSAWIKKESVAKVQKLPSGKFLVQEFKIV